jgi:hypothetical protein
MFDLMFPCIKHEPVETIASKGFFKKTEWLLKQRHRAFASNASRRIKFISEIVELEYEHITIFFLKKIGITAEQNMAYILHQSVIL